MFDYRIEGRWKRQEEIIRGKVWKMIKEEKKLLSTPCHTFWDSAAGRRLAFILQHRNLLFTKAAYVLRYFYINSPQDHCFYLSQLLLELASHQSNCAECEEKKKKKKTFAKTVFFLEVFLLPYTCFTWLTSGPLIRARCVQMSFTGGSNYMITWSTNRLE